MGTKPASPPFSHAKPQVEMECPQDARALPSPWQRLDGSQGRRGEAMMGDLQVAGVGSKSLLDIPQFTQHWVRLKHHHHHPPPRSCI